MNRLDQLLDDFRQGRIDRERIKEALSGHLYADLQLAKLDCLRAARTGFPEVIYCKDKTPDQAAAIFRRMLAHGGPVLGTKASPDHAAAVADLPLTYDPVARTLSHHPAPPDPEGLVLVVGAGASDAPITLEAARTAEIMGSRVVCEHDCGAAGIHRVLSLSDTLRAARAVVAVAGMDGVLPTVVSGLTSAPVVAVPTSVGYGASFQGLAALLTMLNSCAPGVAVVNIDNGFGAGYLAAMINRQAGK